MDTGAAVRADPGSRDIFLRRELSGRVLFLARAVVVAYAVLLILVYLRWLPRWLHDQVSVAASAARLSGGGFPYREVALAASGVAIVAGLAWIALAVLVFLRRSRDLFGLLVSASFLSFGVIFTGFRIIGMERSDSWWPWPAAVLLVANGLSLPWAYVFPDGRFVPRWTIALAAIWLGLSFVPPFGGPPLVPTVILVTLAVASFVYRYLRRSTPIQRQQIKWVFFGGLIFFAFYVVLVPTGALIPQTDQPSQAFHVLTVHSTLLSLGVMAIPVALGIAIFRQGLLNIDLIFNRALTYAAITAILAIGLVTISGVSNWVLGAVAGQRSEWVLLTSVVPVAMAFVPLRARALKIADRFVSDRKVITLLFIDIVGSTDRAYSLGDRSWRELLERFRSTVRRCLRRYGGKEIDTTGDGFFVTFEAPERAIRCAHALVGAVRPLDLEVRVGVHIGDVQVDGSNVEGANVHLAARVMSEAGPSEVLVSRALRDVVAGSDIELRDRGPRQLKGVPGEVQLFAALA